MPPQMPPREAPSPPKRPVLPARRCILEFSKSSYSFFSACVDCEFLKARLPPPKAESEAVLRALQDQFRAHTVGKRYLALVTGRPAPSFTVDAPLGPVPGKADRQMVDAADGKEAVTEVELVEQFERHALVACTIRTGRRHQIRVHLTARGLPVAGDPLYGTRAHAPLPGGRLRLALHAERLAFDHPGTGERVTFEAPLPRDLSAAVEALRRRP